MTFKIASDWQDSKLVMSQTMIPDTRTRERGSKWLATCQIDGREYSAESRSGAPYALARVLINAGIPDQPVMVIIEGHKMGYQSLQWMAEHATAESATQSIHLARWKDPAELQRAFSQTAMPNRDKLHRPGT
jgi:hypothetical protein